MMMNERVEIGGGVSAAAAVVNEQLARLHSKLKRIAKARSHLDLQEAAALRDAQRLGLWRQFGYASLAEYMIRELGYEYRTAQERLRVANALPELPKLAEALQTGELNFSQARELSRVVTPETEDTWIKKTKDMSVREVEQAVAGHCKGSLPEDAPDPRLIRKTLYLSVRPETDVLYREARAKLEKERGEKLDDDAVLEALCRTLLSRAEATAPSWPSHAGADARSPRAGAESSLRGDRREGRNNFTRATREVETREELRRRGFDRDAIKTIMLKVSAHMGTRFRRSSGYRWRCGTPSSSG